MASYEPETWKYNATYESGASSQQLLSHLQNRTSSYYGSLGLKVSFKVQLYDPQHNTSVTSADNGLNAHILTPRGRLDGYVRRDSADASLFYLDFDVDGSTHSDPRGNVPPPLEAGPQTVSVTITQRVRDVPPSQIVGEAELYFTYDMPGSLVSIPAFAHLPYLQSVPDTMFRLYNDIGWGNSVLFVTRGLNKTKPVSLTYQFQSTNQTVELWGFIARRAVNIPGGPSVPVPTPSLPYIPGVTDNKTIQDELRQSDALVSISKKLLGSNQTNALGIVRFNLTSEQLLAIVEPAPPAALVVVAPVLTPNFNRSSPSTDQGGFQFRVGATELVAPITESLTVIDSYRLTDPNFNANNAPGPLRDLAYGVNTIQVNVRDLNGFSSTNPPVRSGEVYALVPDVRNLKPLSGATLSPSQREDNVLSANVLVRPIQDQQLTHYRVFALTYQANDVFYGLTYGDRGYLLSVEAPPIPIPANGAGRGNIVLNFTSKTTNFDGQTHEPGFETRVLFRLDVPGLHLNLTKTYLIPEGGSKFDLIPIEHDQVATFPGMFESTSGDTLPGPSQFQVLFESEDDRDGTGGLIPGVSVPLALFLLAALAAGIIFVTTLARRR